MMEILLFLSTKLINKEVQYSSNKLDGYKNLLGNPKWLRCRNAYQSRPVLPVVLLEDEVVSEISILSRHCINTINFLIKVAMNTRDVSWMRNCRRSLLRTIFKSYTLDMIIEFSFYTTLHPPSLLWQHKLQGFIQKLGIDNHNFTFQKCQDHILKGSSLMRVTLSLL